jgi:oxygen-independent coproporphyrinogen-3 oxidase
MAGVYLHIPLCKKRCIYCDFYSTTELSAKNDYVQALNQEIQLRKDFLDNETVETIYFGGGTPTLLSCSDFNDIFLNLKNNFRIADTPEITVEANPDDLKDRYVSDLKKLPFNRISIGIQSFNDKDLIFLNRRHTAQEAIEAVKRCRKEGFDNISIDLIYGLPGQTIDEWESNLEKALELNVEHISAYNLSYEEGAKIYELRKQGEIKEQSEEQNEFFFNMLVSKLTEAGYIHYEISNFAKRTSDFPEGVISKHNSSYWNGIKYLGLGASAHSYNGDTRSWNVSSLGEYVNSILKKNIVPSEIEKLDIVDKYNDYIITRMRTIRGVSPQEIRKKFGENSANHFEKKASKYLTDNKLIESEGRIKIARDSLFVSDFIILELMSEKTN